MKCLSCIEDSNFRFSLKFVDNQKGVFYTDHSDWLKNSDLSEPYSLEIVSDYNVKTFSVLPGTTLFIPYSSLPINCDYPCNFDGVYTFRAIACENSQLFERHEAVLNSVCKVYDYFLAEYPERFDTDGFELFKLMELIKANARENNIKEANEYYALLVKKIKKLNCNCNVVL
jgi:hypothetical protein